MIGGVLSTFFAAVVARPACFYKVRRVYEGDILRGDSHLRGFSGKSVLPLKQA